MKHDAFAFSRRSFSPMMPSSVESDDDVGDFQMALPPPHLNLPASAVVRLHCWREEHPITSGGYQEQASHLIPADL